MAKNQYHWSHEEMKKLTALRNQGEREIAVLAATTSRKLGALRRKLQRMGLVVGQHKKFCGTTTNKEEEKTRVEKIAHNVNEASALIEDEWKYQTGEYADGGKTFAKPEDPLGSKQQCNFGIPVLFQHTTAGG